MFPGISVADVVNDPPLVSLPAPQSSFKLEALVDDNFVGPEMSLTAHRTVDGAPMSLVHVVPGGAGVVEPVDHVSLVYVREILLF